MKTFFCAIVLFLAAYTAGCQSLGVQSFSLLENDMTARTTSPERDINGELTALIRVVSTASGFVFEGGSLGIVKADQKVGEWWVYVPDGARTLTVRHPQLGVLRNFAYPVSVRGGSVYELVLAHGEVEVVVRQRDILTEFVVIDSEPPGADIYLNNEPVGKTPFSTDKPEGRYEWRVERNLYLTEAGVFELKAGERVNLDLKLKPDFGSVELSTVPEQGASVSLNGIEVGKTTPVTLERLPTGEHTITVSHQWYETTSRKVTISAGDTLQTAITMKPTFAEITVEAESDEEVLVNGTRKGSGTWSGRLSPGAYQIEVTKASHKSAKKQIVLKSGDQEVLDLEPTPIYSSLKVQSTPLDAEVILNGTSYGTTPKIIRDLLVGSYNLELRKQGFGVYKQEVVVNEGETVEINGQLTSMGTIVVQSGTPEVEVYLNGTYKGLAPLEIGELEPRSYEVELKKANHDSFSKTVRIEAGTVERIDVKLQEASASASISSTPSGAKLFVDGRLMGVTPFKVGGLNAGSYSVELNRDGYAPLKRTLYLKTGENTSVNYSMKANRATRVSNQSGADFFMYTYEADNPLGLSIGGIYANRAGYYLNFKMNTDIFTSALWTIDDAGNSEAPGIVERTGEVRNGSIAFSGGVTFKLVYPFWGYLGGGLGYFPVYEYADRYYSSGSFWKEDWLRNTDQTEIGVFPEAGLMLKLGGAIVLKYGGVYRDGLQPQMGFGLQF